MWDWRIQLELQAILKECWTQLPRGKFKKSHLFLLRIWEALFRTFLVNFSTETPTGNKIATQIMDVLKQAEQLTTPDASALLKLIKHTCDDEGKLKKELMQYMHQLSAVDETCKFWMKFILEDCLCRLGVATGTYGWAASNKWLHFSLHMTVWHTRNWYLVTLQNYWEPHQKSYHAYKEEGLQWACQVRLLTLLHPQ